MNAGGPIEAYQYLCLVLPGSTLMMSTFCLWVLITEENIFLFQDIPPESDKYLLSFLLGP